MNRDKQSKGGFKLTLSNARHGCRTLKTALILILMLTMWAVFASPLSAGGKTIITANMEGTITPGKLAFLERKIRDSEKAEAELLVIILDTPGGLVDATISINSAILNAGLPVAVLVLSLIHILVAAALEAGAEVRETVFHRFSPQGVSGVVVISESHLAIHTWPEFGYAAVDVFTCGQTVDPWVSCNYLKQKFSAQNMTAREIKRGIFDVELQHKTA